MKGSTGTMIKVAVVVVGGYLLYMWLDKNGYLNFLHGGASGGALNPGTGAGQGTGTGQGTGQPTQAQIDAARAAAAVKNDTVLANYEATTGGQRNDALQAAAANVRAAVNVPGVLLNWHEWNYYLGKYAESNGVPAQPMISPEDVGLTGRELITAVQYHEFKAKLAPAVSGLAGMMPYQAMASAWRN